MQLEKVIKLKLVQLSILFVSSIVFTVIINSMAPVNLPILLPDGERPGLVEGSWHKKIKYIEIEEVADKISTVQLTLIDIRDSEEFDQLHAKGAFNLPYFEIEYILIEFTEEISTDREIVLFCEGMLCGISARVAKELLDLDYENISIIKQGFDGWKNSNLPLEDGRVEMEEIDAKI